jgi:hypothetical protein
MRSAAVDLKLVHNIHLRAFIVSMGPISDELP